MGDVAVEARAGYLVVGLRNQVAVFVVERCPTEGIFGCYFHIVFKIGVAAGDCEVAVNRHLSAYNYCIGVDLYWSGVDFV